MQASYSETSELAEAMEIAGETEAVEAAKTVEAQDPIAVLEAARELALRSLSVCDRSAAQIQEKLAAKGFPEATIEELLAGLIRVGLIDDRALAGKIARTRSSEGKASRAKIQAELRRKGLAAHAPEVLAQISDSDEYEAALQVLRKRQLPVPKGSMPKNYWQKQRARWYGQLARRGFGAETCVRAVQTVLAETQAQTTQRYISNADINAAELDNCEEYS